MMGLAGASPRGVEQHSTRTDERRMISISVCFGSHFSSLSPVADLWLDLGARWREMRAFFLTTLTNEVKNHILAWESVFGQASHCSFNVRGINNDWLIIDQAKELAPGIIFYIGACGFGGGTPKYATLRELRKIAPIVNLCSDAADHPWHPVLRRCRAEECFDLQVALDGATEAPVDLAVLTPVDPSANHC